VPSVIDASTVLAVCQQEAGADTARDKMRCGLISTVNVSEVYQKSMERGKLPIAEAIIRTANLQVSEFSDEHARYAAELAGATKKMGVSFADRACIALAMAESLPVLTGDRKWLEIPTQIKIELFRSKEHSSWRSRIPPSPFTASNQLRTCVASIGSMSSRIYSAAGCSPENGAVLAAEDNSKSPRLNRKSMRTLR